MLIKSFETYIPNLDLLNWVESQQDTTKFYLKLRDQAWEWAGSGNLFDSQKALLPTLDWTLEDYEDFLSEENVKLFVANKFDLSSSVVLPRFEILKKENSLLFKINLWTSESVDDFKNNFIKKQESKEITIQNTQHTPTEEEWPSYFEKALNTLSGNDKIVLARLTNVSFFREVNTYQLLRNLNQNSYQCLFQLEGETQNISVSPERLFKIEDHILYTEAVAGTRPRGKTDEEDFALEAELKNSNKDKYEHQLVADDIYKILQDFSSGITLDETKVIKQKKVQHLKTEIQADLFPKTLVTEILNKLHPTPAVGGLPRAKSLKWLSENEPFKRDYYAAPIGVMSQDFTEFFVNIRSAQVQGNKMKLYSGVGVVKNSSAQSEWNEMDAKLSQYWDALK